MLQGGNSGPSVVVGKPDESRLIQFVRHQGKAMPKDKPKLSELQIAALAQWVQLGLPWPAGQVVTEAYDWAKAGEHWAFQPVKRPAVPVIDSAWPSSDIDRFVLA